MKKIEFNPKIKIKKILDMRNFSILSNGDFKPNKILNLKIMYDGKEKRISDLFEVKIDSKFKNVKKTVFIINKTNHFFENVGYYWKENKLIVNGDVGSFLGAKMSGGIIELNGNCENFLGANMFDGEIKINGNAMDYVGSAIFGETIGMSGGLIIIKGNAGDFLGSFMRRGLIFVECNVGFKCAKNLIAGTVIIKKNVETCFGNAMKRGTLILKKNPKKIPDYFVDCGIQEFNFPTLFEKFLKNKKIKNSNNKIYRKYIGDRNNMGLGEILVEELVKK
tara:strand:- start:2817 stop:3650 length:834 start_codon:yes stop_codon:yes gene_type:complete